MSDLREEIEKVIKKFLEEEAIALWEKSIGNGTELFTLVQAIEGDEASISNMSFDMANSILSIVEKREEWVSVDRLEDNTHCPQGRTYSNSDVKLLVGQSNCRRCKGHYGMKNGFTLCNPSELPQPQRSDR